MDHRRIVRGGHHEYTKSVRRVSRRYRQVYEAIALREAQLEQEPPRDEYDLNKEDNGIDGMVGSEYVKMSSSLLIKHSHYRRDPIIAKGIYGASKSCMKVRNSSCRVEDKGSR